MFLTNSHVSTKSPMNRQKKVNIWDSMNFYVLQNYLESVLTTMSITGEILFQLFKNKIAYDGTNVCDERVAS